MKTFFPFATMFTALVAILTTAGCAKIPDGTTVEEIDKKSVAAGMRGISSQWRLVKSDSDERGTFLGWVYGSNHRWNRSSAKTVFLNTNAEMISSEDFYYSGRQFNDLEVQNIAERLIIHYNYSNSLCDIRLITDNEALKAQVSSSIADEGASSTEALKIADEILSQWKVKRDK
jgi:hypothetical protein